MEQLSRSRLRFLGVINNTPLVGPRNVNIHITNVCNLNCNYCWYNYPGNKNKSGVFLSYECLAGIVKDCQRLKVESICLSGEGEPTLHPDICNIVRLIKANNIRLVLLTNGTWHTNFLRIAHLADTIRVNISAPSKNQYLGIHGKDMFNQVIKNVLMLNKLKCKKKLVCPSTEFVFILNKQTYSGLKTMVSLAKKIGVNRITVKMMSPTKENKQYALTKQDIPLIKKILFEINKANEEVKISNNFDDIYNQISKEGFLEPRQGNSVEYFSNFAGTKNMTKCYIGYYFAQIDLAGDVTLCCINRRFIVGNICNKSFFDIWNSKQAQDFRIKSKCEIDLDIREWKDCNHCLQWKFLLSLNKRIDECLKGKK